MTAREQAEARDRVARHLLEQREQALQADLQRIMRDHQSSTSWHREAIQMRENGLFYKDIERQLGVPTATIRQVCDKAGAVPKTLSDPAKARRLRTMGFSYRQIQRRTGLSYRQVRQLCDGLVHTWTDTDGEATV